MTRPTLRRRLVWVGYIAFPALVLTTAMLIFGRYIDTPERFVDMSPLTILQFLTSMSGAATISTLSFWAAQNLGDIKFPTYDIIMRMITVSVWFNIAGLVCSVLAFLLELLVYERTLGVVIPSLGYMLSMFIYPISSILLLKFVRLQMVAKSAGEKLKETSLTETFS